METETYHYEILPYICLINTFRIVVISVLPEEKGCVDAVEPGVYEGHTEGHLETTGQELSVRSLNSSQPDGKTD